METQVTEMKTANKERRLLILGAGGFGQVVKELADELGIYYGVVFLDDAVERSDVIGKLADYEKFCGEYTHALVAMGNNQLRLEWLERLEQAGYRLPVLRSPFAWVSGSAVVEKGTVVLPFAHVGAHAVVGRGCILNAGSIVDHNCTVGEGCHICLNSVVKNQATVPSCTKVEAGEVFAPAR